MNDWRDRTIDAALQELHGSPPPDLTARVLLALQDPALGPLPRLVLPRRRWLRLAVLVGVFITAGAVAGGVLAGFVGGSPDASQGGEARTSRFALAIEVLSGEVVSQGRGSAFVAVHGAGSRSTFVAQPGARLTTEPASAFRIGPFGELAAGPRTELEVQSMEFTTKHGVVAAASLTLAVVAGAVTWNALSRTETAVAGGTLRLDAPSDAGSAAALAAENDRLRERLADLERQNEALQTQAAQRQAAAVAPMPEVVEEPPPPPAAVALAFSDPRYAEALAKIDWKAIGATTNEMGPVLAQLVAAMAAEGAEIPVDLAIKVQQLNQKLIEQVPAMLESGLPGFGPNGTYTHPLVAANTLASTLEAAGQPLTTAQRQAIDGLVRSFSVENQAIADASRDFTLEQLAAEVEMKERFYREVNGMLAPAQHGAMHPEGAGVYDGSSLFGPGLLTQVHAQPVPARDAADFARIASGKLSDQLGLDEAATAQVRSILAVTAVAPELWRDRGDPTETSALRMMRAGRTQAALRSQLAWMRAIQRQVALTPEQKKKLASMKNVLVPLPR